MAVRGWRRWVVGLALVLAVAECRASDEEDLAAMGGEWELVALSVNGADIPDAQRPEIRFEIGEDGAAVAQTPDGTAEATLSIDSGADPKQVDALHTGGLHEDKTQYGIYKIDGDSLTFAMSEPGADPSDRPDDFGKGVTMTFRRVN